LAVEGVPSGEGPVQKVLIVDDEPHVIRMLKDKLRNAGIGVICAVNGNEAVRMARAEMPRAIIMDWIMPETNGLDACREIRAIPAHEKTPIIMLTVRSQEIDEQKGREAGASFYVTKPFSPHLLLRLVEDCLETS
jgi:two-component system alkaline phosphatase synthesis response regulator PhoP